MRADDNKKTEWQYNSLKNQLQDQSNDANARKERETFMDGERLKDTLMV